MMEKEIVRKVKEAVRTIEPDAEIYPYGSRARQDARSDSDWDFLLPVDGVVDTARTDRIRHRLYRRNSGDSLLNFWLHVRRPKEGYGAQSSRKENGTP